MRTASGVQRRYDGTDTNCFAGGRFLLGLLLAAIGSVAFTGIGVEAGRASPVELASISPGNDSRVLSLKESSAIAARVPQDSLSSGYDIGSKALELAVPMPPIKPAPKHVNVVAALRSQAACETGGMFDACPGFLDLLQSRQQAWPGFADAAFTTANAVTTGSLSRVMVASASDDVSLLTEGLVKPPVDRVALRAGEVIMGAASTYNPYNADDNDAGGAETASGEIYNPIAWTAAIQTDLRDEFAGVRYGRLYKPSFALIELNGRRAIVKINDVGPLRPGRVIDLSQQVMHYFDPSLRRGVLDGMLVTPLIGTNWTPGPLGTTPAVEVASNLP